MCVCVCVCVGVGVGVGVVWCGVVWCGVWCGVCVIFFFFFFKLGKKSPKSHWERGRISAPEETKKNPCNQIVFSDWAVLDKVSTAIRNYRGHAQRAIKMSRKLSHSATAWKNYIPAFLTVI